MRKISKSLFFTIILLFPTQIALHLWPDWSHVMGARVDYLSLAVYATDIFIIALIAINLRDIFKAVFQYKSLVFLALLLAVVNLLNAASFEVALLKWLKLAEFGFFAIWINKNGQVSKEMFFKILPLVVISTTLIGIAQFLLGRNIGGPFYYLGERPLSLSMPGVSQLIMFGKAFLRPYSVFPHPNAFSGFLIVSLGFLFSQKSKSFVSKTAIIFASICVFLSFSQAAWIAGIVCLLYFYANSPIKRALKSWIVFTLLISSLLFLVASWKIYSADLILPAAIQTRVALSVVAGNLISSHPIFGVGLNNFIVKTPAVVQYFPDLFSGIRFAYLQPVHNIFLLVLTETGITGLLVFAYLLNWKLKSAGTLAVCLIAVLVTGVFDHYWLTLQQNQILLTLLLALPI